MASEVVLARIGVWVGLNGMLSRAFLSLSAAGCIKYVWNAPLTWTGRGVNRFFRLTSSAIFFRLWFKPPTMYAESELYKARLT